MYTKHTWESLFLIYIDGNAHLCYSLMFVLVYIAAVYLVNLTETRQTIIGFGGAFTDAAGINIAALPADAQDHLINSYYSKDGKSLFKP